MTDLEHRELEEVFESIFDTACEGHTIDPKVREKLDDSSFGLVEVDENGEKKRSYPLVVPGNKKKTDELITKAVQFFHYCKQDRREKLAKAIVSAIAANNSKIEISEASQILRYVDKSSLPKTVTIVPRKPRSR